MVSMRYLHHPSPVGPLLIAGTDRAIRRISFSGGRGAMRPRSEWRRDDNAFQEARRQLDAYFSGGLTGFDLPLEFSGSEFQVAVWNALRDIPFGETVSYGEIARRIGEPMSSSRAVGAANGANPLPIVIPCHRVIGADGSLTGFGGGLPIKRFLLDHERRIRPLPGEQLRLFG